MGPGVPHDDPLSLDDKARDELAERMGRTRQYVDDLISHAGTELAPTGDETDDS